MAGSYPLPFSVSTCTITGPSKRFANMFPDRFFDVGIAEEHAVTFAAGLALGGLIPVVAIYSSFLQRAFDQIMHDVCMQNLHVVFAIDRGGLVGNDGKTHQGVFDLSYLNMMPNMTVMAPKNKWELSDMMKFAVHYDGPVAIRYPRGEAYTGLEEYRAPVEYQKAEWIYHGEEVAILAVGSRVRAAEKAVEVLRSKGWNPTLVNMRFVKPFDQAVVQNLNICIQSVLFHKRKHLLSEPAGLYIFLHRKQTLMGFCQFLYHRLIKGNCRKCGEV